jgi:hypothetical protein
MKMPRTASCKGHRAGHRLDGWSSGLRRLPYKEVRFRPSRVRIPHRPLVKGLTIARSAPPALSGPPDAGAPSSYQYYDSVFMASRQGQNRERPCMRKLSVPDHTSDPPVSHGGQQHQFHHAYLPQVQADGAAAIGRRGPALRRAT